MACAPLSGALLGADKGNPLAVRYPEDGAVLCIGPAGVSPTRRTPMPRGCSWNGCSAPSSRAPAWRYGVDPVRLDVEPMPGAKKLSEVKLVRLTPEEIGKGIPEIIEQWRDTFGG